MTDGRQDAILRRSARLINAVLQLHKQGFQNLAIEAGLSASGFHWRLQLHAFSNIALDEYNETKIINPNLYELAVHSSGDMGNEYFGWRDSRNSTSHELAGLIRKRFPRLIAQARGDNFIYSGWLCRVVGRAEEGQLPIMYSDDGSNNTDKGPLSFTDAKRR